MLEEINSLVQQKLKQSKTDVLKFVFNHNIDSHLQEQLCDCEYHLKLQQYIYAKKSKSYYNKRIDHYGLMSDYLYYSQRRDEESNKARELKYQRMQIVQNSKIK